MTQRVGEAPTQYNKGVARAAVRSEMRIHTKDFRVRAGDEVHLEKWPTKVDPVYKSKDQYKTELDPGFRTIG
jgi:hypothetical protein